MPESAAIGLIVLGGVLLLVGLVGGKREIFGAKVEGTPSRISRAAAFLVGCVCLLAGIGLMVPDEPTPDERGETAVAREDSRERRTAEDAPPVEPPPEAERYAPEPPPEPEEPPERRPQLAGVWHDGSGTTVRIHQAGPRLRFEGTNTMHGYHVVGEGMLEGRLIELTTTTSYGLVSSGTGVVSADGTTIQFTMSGGYGGYTFALQRAYWPG